MSLKVPAIEPWHSVIERTAKDLDAINIMAYDYYWPVIIIVIIVISISTIKVIIKIFKDIPLAGLHRFFHQRYSEIKVTQKYVLVLDISLLQGYTNALYPCARTRTIYRCLILQFWMNINYFAFKALSYTREKWFCMIFLHLFCFV